MNPTIKQDQAYNPMVSVIMPVYNAEKFLKQAIDSILNQTYKQFELIIVNDGSTDLSETIILNYEDSRIKYLRNDGNKGLVFSLNSAISKALGKYIARMDADDLADKKRLQLQVNFLEKNSDYGMCGTFYKTIDESNKIIKTIQLPETDLNARTSLLLANCFCHSTITIRTELIKELMYRQDFLYVEDYDLWLRVAEQVKIANLPSYTLLYRNHENNISVTKQQQMFSVTKKLNADIFTNLDVLFSTEDLERHGHALWYNNEFFQNYGRLQELENWLVYFYKKASASKNINALLLYELLIERWIVICYKNKRTKKLLNNKLFLIRKKTYLKVLYKKITKKQFLN